MTASPNSCRSESAPIRPFITSTVMVDSTRRTQRTQRTQRRDTADCAPAEHGHPQTRPPRPRVIRSRAFPTRPCGGPGMPSPPRTRRLYRDFTGNPTASTGKLDVVDRLSRKNEAVSSTTCSTSHTRVDVEPHNQKRHKEILPRSLNILAH